jgi:hypothetical protein
MNCWAAAGVAGTRHVFGGARSFRGATDAYGGQPQQTPASSSAAGRLAGHDWLAGRLVWAQFLCDSRHADLSLLLSAQRLAGSHGLHARLRVAAGRAITDM